MRCGVGRPPTNLPLPESAAHQLNLLLLQLITPSGPIHPPTRNAVDVMDMPGESLIKQQAQLAAEAVYTFLLQCKSACSGLNSALAGSQRRPPPAARPCSTCKHPARSTAHSPPHP